MAKVTRSRSSSGVVVAHRSRRVAQPSENVRDWLLARLHNWFLSRNQRVSGSTKRAHYRSLLSRFETKFSLLLSRELQPWPLSRKTWFAFHSKDHHESIKLCILVLLHLHFQRYIRPSWSNQWRKQQCFLRDRDKNNFFFKRIFVDFFLTSSVESKSCAALFSRNSE